MTFLRNQEPAALGGLANPTKVVLYLAGGSGRAADHDRAMVDEKTQDLLADAERGIAETSVRVMLDWSARGSAGFLELKDGGAHGFAAMAFPPDG
jgi:hypothetical protein